VEYNISKKLKFSSSAYRTTIYDQIEANSAYSKHENKTTDLNQEGIENELFFKGIDKSISIFANFTKSRNVSGGHQSRRPDLTYGSNFSKKILFNKYGLFNINLNYKFTDRYLDWDGSANTFQKSTNLIDLSIKKNWLENSISFNITNLLNERYEKPATYSQDGRQFRFNFTKSY
jgi:outer membrane cobalamin receptor